MSYMYLDLAQVYNSKMKFVRFFFDNFGQSLTASVAKEPVCGLEIPSLALNPLHKMPSHQSKK